jgi:hypothetical protein
MIRMIRAVSAIVFRQSVAQKGFRPLSGRDHETYALFVEGKKTRWQVRLSHGRSQITANEIRLNARPLGIKGDDLYKILSCDHDLAATLELFTALHPSEVTQGEPDPAGEHAARVRALEERIVELRSIMESAESLDEEGLAELGEEYAAKSRELAALKRQT